MKKVFLMMLAVASISLVSCGGKTGSASAETSEPAQEENVYENAKAGYSVVLPDGYVAQSSSTPEIEAQNGGKKFVKGEGPGAEGNEITTEARENAEPYTAESIKSNADGISIDETAGQKLISKDVKPTSCLVKWYNGEAYRAQFYTYKGKMVYSIDFYYPEKNKAAYDEEVDKVVASFQMK